MKKIKILLVEDRKPTWELIKAYLHDIDHSLDIVTSGESAILELGKHDFDVIILDIELAGKLDGIEMLREVQKLNIKIPAVIVLSKYYDFKYKGEAYNLGVFDFINKSELDESFKEKVIAAASQKINYQITKDFYCFKHPQGCRGTYEINPNIIFVGINFVPDDIYLKGIKPVIESLNLQCRKANEILKSGDYSCKICAIIQSCKFAIFDISELRPNVFLEIGFACALGKEVFILKHEKTELPSNLSGFEVIEYNKVEDLKISLFNYLESYKVENSD